MKRIFSRRFHAVLDYLSAAILLAAPWVLGFSDSQSATYVAVGAGVLIVILSLCTNYEGGVFRKVSMGAHLVTDIMLGLFLALSPWLFGFEETVYLPHLIMGLFAICAGFLTKSGSLRHAI